MQVVKRLLKYYHFEILIAITMLYIAVSFSYLSNELISAFARKFFLWGSGLAVYYIARIIKIGVIDWDNDWNKIYAISLLIYTGIIFAFG